MKRLLQLTLVLFIATGLATVANAQPDITASATVDAQLTINPEQNLTFGTLTPNSSTSVAVTDGASAGQFSLSGNGGQIVLGFTFANGGNLVGPGDDIPITFDGSSAAYGPDASSPNTTFDPTAGTTTSSALSADPDNQIWVFIGGSITTAPNQTAGNYEETITLTASYN